MMTRSAATLPAFAGLILGRRLPCAILGLAMFSAILWLPKAGASLLPMAPLATALGLFIHLLTPGLFAMVFFGGGFAFSLQAGLLASILTGLINLSLLPGWLLLVLYVLLPVLSSYLLLASRGIERSLYCLSIGLGIAVLLALALGASNTDLSLQAYTDQLLAPFFAPFAEQIPAGVDAQAFREALSSVRQTTVMIFPGAMTLFAWLIWMGNVLLARRLAKYYGFFNGPELPLSGVHFSKRDSLVFSLLLLIAALLTGGTIQYLALNASIALAGLFVVQGLAVTLVWLNRRGIRMLTLLLFPILVVQPVMILPFIILGLFDVWFDYRGKNHPANGGI